MRRFVKILAVVLPVLLVLIGVGAYQVTLGAWDQVVGYESPCAYPLGAVPAKTPPLTDRVVIAIVDGLRQDTVPKMPYMAELGRQWASATLVTGQPSLSLPAQAVFGTGALQEVTGVTTNWYSGPCRLDSVFAAAKRAGKSAAVFADGGWQQLFGDYIDGGKVIDWSEQYDDQVLAAGIECLNEPVSLIVVHFAGVDHIGHLRGAASAEYAATAAAIDRRLETLGAALDLNRDTLIIVSDHGHVAAGGHGGWDAPVVNAPAVLAGHGVLPGQLGTKSQADLAPTVCALLGLSYPAQATGTPLFDALAFDPVERAAAAAGLVVTRMAFTVAYVDDYSRGRLNVAALASVLRANDQSQGTLDQSVAADECLRQARLEARNDAVARARRARALPALAAIILPLAGLWFLAKRRLALPALIGALHYFVIYYGRFFGRGYRFSLSAFNSEDQIMGFFMARLGEAALATAVAALTAGIVYATFEWRRAARLQQDEARPSGWAGAAAGATAAGMVVYLILVQAAVYYYLHGISVTNLLPDLGLGFKFFLDLLQMAAAGVASLAAPLLGVAGWGIVRLCVRARRG